MLEFDGIDIFKGLDVNKTDGLRECIICHYRYFLNINSRYKPEVCHGCHDLMVKAMIFNDVIIFIF